MITFFFIHFHAFYRLAYFFYNNINDRKKIYLIKQYVTEGMTVIDIGANIGFYTILLSQLVGEKGKVYAFEPDPTNFFFLQANTKKYRNVVLQQKAVGDKTGEIMLYLSKDNVDHHTYATEEVREAIKISCVTLDAFFSRTEKIQFIKSDIQGYDYFAMLGAEQMIKRQKHLLIIGEFWPFGLVKAGIASKKYITLLKKLGLTVTLPLSKPLPILEKQQMYYTDFVGIKNG
jgi:FkbM family methyltransferase